mmetsp:Transcript_13021/g.34110  ORF Transcript_13021/g.34110 Transcript_13021/m.34110 type:complete len:216 (-) Transcript_13021:421-1068(-)
MAGARDVGRGGRHLQGEAVLGGGRGQVAPRYRREGAARLLLRRGAAAGGREVQHADPHVRVARAGGGRGARGPHLGRAGLPRDSKHEVLLPDHAARAAQGAAGHGQRVPRPRRRRQLERGGRHLAAQEPRRDQGEAQQRRQQGDAAQVGQPPDHVVRGQDAVVRRRHHQGDVQGRGPKGVQAQEGRHADEEHRRGGLHCSERWHRLNHRLQGHRR